MRRKRMRVRTIDSGDRVSLVTFERLGAETRDERVSASTSGI